MAMAIELRDEKIGLMAEFVEVESSSSTSTYRDSFHSEEERVYKEVSLDVPYKSTLSRIRSRLGLDRTTYKTESIWRQCCKSAAIAIIPSFLHKFVLEADSNHEPLRPTAYLDGLRGVAALSVVLCHLSLDWFPISAKVAYRPGESDSVLQMPWIRNIYCGRASVCVSICVFVLVEHMLTCLGLFCYIWLCFVRKGFTAGIYWRGGKGSQHAIIFAFPESYAPLSADHLLNTDCLYHRSIRLFCA